MKTDLSLPFQPIRADLYDYSQLLSGFDPATPQSLTEIPDFKIFQYFVVHGRAAPADPYAAMMEALHDNSILQAMFSFLAGEAKTVAITGGHDEPRGSVTYTAVVEISKRLAELGFLMASGGGPGVMEATHLGAMLKGKNQDAVKQALDLLEVQTDLPDSNNIVDENGVANPDIVARVHAWLVPAFQLRKASGDVARSLAVPTWYYGHEPVTPFATHIAKYFQNSIREDVLLALAANGVVYAPGRAGTLQEVFQDAAQDYYHSVGGVFSPMVFFDSKFWRETLPVEPLVRDLFVKNGREKEYKAKVRYLDTVEEVVEFLIGQQPSGEKTMNRFEALGMGPIMMRAFR